MRDYNKELNERVTFIQNYLKAANANGIVYGNSGGKDSALVSILCKKATPNVLGVIMPCQSKQNFGTDREDALKVAKAFGIETVEYDLTTLKQEYVNILKGITENSIKNIAPRLRMITLYTIAQSKGYLVAGTGNRSEAYMGYFTKWGDGAYDINPISDLTVTEIYEFLRFLNAPESVIKKAPSAGLYEGQTDEGEMGITYNEIDNFLLNNVEGKNIDKIKKVHQITAHKRLSPIVFKNIDK